VPAETEPAWIATFVAWSPLVPLVFLVYFSFRLWSLLSPMWPLARGEYATARRGFERTTRFWLPSAARASRYNVALCLELEGRLAEAEARARELLAEKLDERLAYAARSLLGTILVLREHSLEEARALLDAVQAQIPTPLGALLLAHAHLGLGDTGGAAQHVAEALTMPQTPSQSGHGWKASLRFEPELHRSMENFFRGWYFYKVGDLSRARIDFDLACRSPLAHVCTARARMLLASASRPGFDIEDPPSSLSPYEFP
jgi:tetratricopeptide (TPR) repeat protein